MMLTEVGRAATIARDACAAFLAQPADGKARRTLFEALVPLADPTFTEGADHAPVHVRGLIRQVCTISEIVMVRISAGLVQPGTFPATSIQGVVRDLNRVLDDLNQVLAGRRKG